MLKFLCIFAAASVLSTSAYVRNDIGFDTAARNNLRTLIGGLEENLEMFFNDAEALPDSVHKQIFISKGEVIRDAAYEMQANLFEEGTDKSIVEYWRLHEELDTLIKELKNFKGSTTAKPPTSCYSSIDAKKAVDMTCSAVDKSKAEIMTYPPEQCSGSRLLPNLTDCQSLCTRVKPYFYDGINLPSLEEQHRNCDQLDKCQSIVDVWKLLRSIQPDRATLDQTCKDIDQIGYAMDNSPIANCDKDPYIADQKILSSICSRLQKEYNNINPDSLLSTYKDLVDKQNNLKYKWDSFASKYPQHPSPTSAPYVTSPAGSSGSSFTNLYHYSYQGKSGVGKSATRGGYISIFKPLYKF